MASNNETTWKKVKSDIADDKIERFYLFYGEESYLLQFYKNELIRALVDEGMKEFNLLEYNEKVTVNELIDAVDSYPVMSDKKLVIVSGLDVFKADEEFKTRFIDLLNDIPEYCTLLIIAAAEFKPDKRQKLYSAMTKNGAVIEFERASRGDLIEWIKRRFKAQKKNIDNSLCEYLIFYCGSLMQALIPEIDKIAAYSGSDNITKEDINAVATPNAEAVVFDLTDAIVARKYSLAIEILDKLIYLGEEPIMLHGLIGRQMRQIYAACLLQGNGGIPQLMQMWGMRSEYPAKIIFNAARGVGIAWARNAVVLCAETDAKLKYGAKEEALKELIARLASFDGGAYA